MDFHSMNRKELQALCKTHKIPANLSNLEMAKRLAEYFKEIENSANQGLISGQDEHARETESANMVVDKKVKKVRFSPQHELIEFTRSPGISGRIRRNSVSIRTSISSVENADSDRRNTGNADRQCRVTRSRGTVLIEGHIIEKKGGRKGVTCSEQRTNDPTIENLDNGGLGDGRVGGTVRVLRSTGKTIAEGTNNAKGNENALHSVDDEKPVDEIVDRTVRVTRSRCQKLTEVTLTETKRVRKLVEIVDDVPFVSGEADAKRVATRHSSRKGVEINGKQREEDLEGEADAKRVATRHSSRKGVEISGKQSEEDLEGEADAKRVATRRSSRKGVEINGKQRDEVLEGEVDAKRVVTRHSSRKGVEINYKQRDKILEGEADAKRVVTRRLEKTEKIEEVNHMIAPRVLVRRSKRNATSVCNSQISSKSSRKSQMLLAEDSNTENGISKGKCDGCVLPPIKTEVRRSNRHKDLVEVHENGRNVELKEETENTRQLRCSAPQSVISGRVPKNQKKMPQSPIETMMSSRRKTSILVNCEAEKHLSKDFPVEKGPSAFPNNARRSGRVTSMCKQVKGIDERGGDSIVQQRNAARKRKGPISEEVVKVGNDLGSLKQSVEECINEKDVPITEVQLSLSDGVLISNLGLSTDTKNKSKSITRKTQREEQVVSIAYTSKSTDMDFVGSYVLANTAFLRKDISAKDEETVDSVEFVAQDIIEQDITNMVKNQFEVQLCCQIKGSSCVNTTDKQILHEDTNVSGIEGFAETISSVNSDLFVDLEVTEAEANTHTQAGSIVVGEVDGISVQENLDIVETGQANVISLSNACHHINVDPMVASNIISDAVSKAHEVDASELCEKVDEGALQLMDPSIATAGSMELEETYMENGIVPVKEIEKAGCLKVKRTGSNDDDDDDDDDVFSMADLFGGERSVGITPQDRGVMSAGYSTMKSDEQVTAKESLAVSPIITSPNITNMFLERDLETEHTCQGEESYIDKYTHYDVAVIYEVGSPDCLGDGKFAISNSHKITPQDREILSEENSIKHQRVEGDEASARKDNQSESAKISESGCSKNRKGTKYEVFGFSVTNLFDGEESDEITPQVRGVLLTQDSSKDLNEQVVFDDLHAVSTMYNEIKISAGASSSKKISPSEPNTFPKSLGDRHIIFNNEAVPVAIGDETHQMFNLADEHTTEYTPSQVEQPNSPSAMPTAIEGQEVWKDASETGSAMSVSQTYGKGITCPVLDYANTDADDGKDKHEFVDEFMRDADISMDCAIGKLGDERFCDVEFLYTEKTEYQPKNLCEKHIMTNSGEKPNDVKPSQSWTGIEHNNVFEVTMIGVNRLNSLTYMKEKEVEGEIASESAKTTHENALLPTNYKEVSVSNPSSGVDWKDNQLKVLFATPIKIASPSIVDETSNHEEKSDIADVSIAVCVDTTMENSAAQIKSDENVPTAETEIESSLFLGFNEVDSIKLVNVSTVVPCESSMMNTTENTCDECLKRSDFITEEISDKKVITLAETTENDSELREGYTISSVNSDEPESCQDIINTVLSENLNDGNRVSPKAERKIAPSNGAEFELSDHDTQKTCVLENSPHPTSCYEDDNLSETYIDTFNENHTDAEVENIGCCLNGEKHVKNTGTSLNLLPKASNDGGEITERKYESEEDDDVAYEARICDEKDDDFTSFCDITDEPNCTSEVEKLKSPSVGDTLDYPSTCNVTCTIAQNIDNVLPAAEEGFSVSCTEFDEFSNLAMYIFAEDNENVDRGRSEAGTPVLNSVGDHENNSKEVEKSSNSISELHLEQKVVDSGNDATDYENGGIEKSDTGTPLFNLEGDHGKKNDKEAEEKSAATIVQFPISELHLEEEILESNKDVPTAAFGVNEFLKESDVHDTITDYIDSELSPCEDGLQTESLTECKRLEEAISVDDVHVGGEEQQMEEMLFKESPTGPDPASVDLVGDSVSGGHDALLVNKEETEPAEDMHVVSTSGELCMTAKENARTILIHGTPSKVMAIADMKENAPTLKSANLGNFTAVRPAKRKALQDVQWK